MQNIHIDTSRRKVTLNIEVEVPFEQARAFLDAMTGNDSDVVLAAEKAIRARLHGESEEEVELLLPEEGLVRQALREADHAQRVTHGSR